MIWHWKCGGGIIVENDVAVSAVGMVCARRNKFNRRKTRWRLFECAERQNDTTPHRRISSIHLHFSIFILCYCLNFEMALIFTRIESNGLTLVSTIQSLCLLFNWFLIAFFQFIKTHFIHFTIPYDRIIIIVWPSQHTSQHIFRCVHGGVREQFIFISFVFSKNR